MVAVTVSACRMATDFKCANNLCLPNSVKCDGYNHCGDGSDEAELCGAFSFTVVKFIRHMDNAYILETRLYVLHACFLPFCPRNCLSSVLYTVHKYQRGLNT